jgi:hypothetical protein
VSPAAGASSIRGVLGRHGIRCKVVKLTTHEALFAAVRSFQPHLALLQLQRDQYGSLGAAMILEAAQTLAAALVPVLLVRRRGAGARVVRDSSSARQRLIGIVRAACYTVWELGVDARFAYSSSGVAGLIGQPYCERVPAEHDSWTREPPRQMSESIEQPELERWRHDDGTIR